MSTLYEGCWHKLDRAKKHVDELKRDIRAWGDLQTKPPYRLRKEFKPDLNCFSYSVVSIDTLPIEWNLIIGDALTNFRAALDYLAHDLVGRGSEPQFRGTQKPLFVICRDSKDFMGQMKGRMPGIKPAHWTVVEYYQPYWWGPVKELHPLFMLDELVRRDKHREIQPVFAQNSLETRMKVVRAAGFVVTGLEPGAFYEPWWEVWPLRFYPGAEILRVFGQQTGPNPDVVVEFNTPLNIAFDGGAVVQSVFDEIGTMIARLFSDIEPVL